MSCYVGYVCKTCDIETYHWYNNGQEKLQTIYSLWPEIKKLLDAIDSKCPQEPVIDVTISSPVQSGNSSEIIEFLYDHYGHDVLIRDEYGKTYPIEVDDSESE